MFPGGVRALFVLLLSVGVCASLPRSARAWTELLSMDVLPEQAGWTLIDDGNPFSSSVVSGGILALNASSTASTGRLRAGSRRRTRPPDT